MLTLKNYFLTRSHDLLEIAVLDETAFKRNVQFLEGEQKGKTFNAHPKGVAWGTMYPRIFQATEKPQHLFVFKGRALVNSFPHLSPEDLNAVPTVQEYRFQPFVCDVIDSIHSNENILLTGGTGVGKTTHIVQLAARIKQPLLRINFNGETRMSDLIGKMNVINGQTIWVDGILPIAMRRGYWLLLDEIDFADPAVLSLLHPVLEQNPQLTLKENGGEIIKPHPNFRVFGTANSIGAMSERASSYGGTNTMNEAFLDRWQVLMVDNLPEKEEVKVIRSEAPGLALKTVRRIVSFANMARNQNFENSQVTYNGDNFSTRKVLAWAKKAALHRDPISGAKKAWLDKMPISDQTFMMNVLTTHFGSKKKKTGLKRMIKKTKPSGSKKSIIAAKSY